VAENEVERDTRWFGFCCPGDQRTKRGYGGHEAIRYKIIRGSGSRQDRVICRACATEKHMPAMGRAERRR